jgi:hypothetical protein
MMTELKRMDCVNSQTFTRVPAAAPGSATRGAIRCAAEVIELGSADFRLWHNAEE